MLEERIKALELTARRLEPAPPDRAAVRDAVLQYADTFLDTLAQRPIYDDRPIPPDAWNNLAVAEAPLAPAAVLGLIHTLVDSPGLNPASAGHLGYIPGGGIYHAALGDYLAAVTNRYAGVQFASPGAVRVEHALVRWMAGLLGFPESSAGTLTSGGSIANLIGVVCARDASGIKARDWHRTVVYTTGHVHHCLDKALHAAGLVESVRRHVPMDECYRMNPAALRCAIEDDRRAGLLPLLVVASAGTTDVGAIDPLNAIADIARDNSVWLHIDAAYGGFFILTDAGRRKLAGMERADSVVMDPHKGLFLPYGLGAVLVRDRRVLRRAFEYHAAYMQDAVADADSDSPADLSPELSRHFRGMRLWLPLRLNGLAPFRAGLEEKLLLARYACERLTAMPGFDVLHEPELSVVAFRYVPRRGDANAFNLRLREMVQKDGRVFISSTTIGDKVALRLAILCFRSHLETVQTVLRVLQDSAQALECE